jgi:hypothetical protein
VSRERKGDRAMAQGKGIETEIVKHIVYVNAQPNGVFTIAVATESGREIAFGISATETAKIVDGINSSSAKLKGETGVPMVAAKVDHIDFHADTMGHTILVSLHAGPTVAHFALPIDCVDQVADGLRAKAAETGRRDAELKKSGRTRASKQPRTRNRFASVARQFRAMVCAGRPSTRP